MYTLVNAWLLADPPGLGCELINLHILPWDVETVIESIKKKTGRLVLAQEASVRATVMESPTERVGGWDTPFPLVIEKFYVPAWFVVNYETVACNNILGGVAK